MQSFGFSFTDEGLHIDGIQDADKAFTIPKELSKKLVDLHYHLTDLDISISSLNYILNNQKIENFVKESLWRSAIIHFTKCFTHQVTKKEDIPLSRARLDEAQLFSNLDPIALESFKYFKLLRNKHIVHDETAHLNSIPAVILNNGEKEFKVERVICIGMLAETLDQPSFSNLYNLVKSTRSFLIKEFDEECNRLKLMFENYSDEDFTNLDILTVTFLSKDEMKKPRK
ncbi:hypothetical protein C3408_11895 [Candidatus Pantoea alvi]|uniref:hypothetical protein n=1 Tax=Enterobacter agglomerans TaxID=549 RepID=UPI000CDDD486|nr:hypothetical protein [Pantoea agglomerans]POW57004.1 hypothetical protein C3408_11895 [Pantoea alvi]UBN52760.1 hypothetical protein LB453_12745 [Pantoea agglomerans]